MEEEEIINKECYYKKEPDNAFFNYSVHGLNFEGIKKYYSITANNKFNHMIRLNKDLEKIIEDSKIAQKERQKKYDINNRYNEERLIKMYTDKRNENHNTTLKQQFNTLNNNNKNKSIKILDKFKILNKPITLKIEEKNNDKIEKEELKQTISKTIPNKIMNYSSVFCTPKKDKILSNFKNNKIKTIPNSLNKHNNRNCFYTPKNFNKTNLMNKISLPIISPRKIIINTFLYNNSGVEIENRRFGHNNYMGVSFNPYNYYSVPKNRVARNQYGALFLH